MKTRILLIEDSVSQRRAFADYLRSTGYDVYEAWSMQSAKLLLPSVKPDVIILDLQLGEEDATTFLSIKEVNRVPALVISADGRVDKRIDCLSLGAFDYMVKPIDLRELQLRVAKLEGLSGTKDTGELQINLGPMSIDILNRTVSAGEAEPVALTNSEFSLLMIFLKSQGEILSRRVLTERMHFAQDAESRSIDVLVSKVRRKLQLVGQRRLIWSVRNEGYRLATENLAIPRHLMHASVPDLGLAS